MTDLPPVERLQAVEVRPDDVIIATTARTLNHLEQDNLERVLHGAFPRNKVLLVTGGATIEVQRPAVTP